MAPIRLTGSTYAENFDTLATAGTANTLPPGWEISEAGTSALVNGQYSAGTGSSNTGDTYSFGAAGSTERALGGLQSGTLTPTIGASFINDTGNTITALNIAYTGEQWRLGTAGRADRLDFQYSLDATSLTSGIWFDFDGLDFSSPTTTGTLGALNGNAEANRTLVSASITSLSIPPGATVWIRWNSFDASGADDGLAVDEFSLTPITGEGAATPTVTLSSPDSAAAEAGQDPGTFRITRTGDTANALDVTYTLSGTATSDDYAPLTGTAVIAAGQSFVDIILTPIDDALLEGSETVTLTLTDGADYDLGAENTATVVITDNDQAPTRIRDIQGAAHVSPLAGQGVSDVAGIVTAIASNGFYFQDPTPDDNPATSEAIFVFTGANAPLLTSRTVGEAILVSGTVSEFRPGNNPNNLTITQISNNNSVKSLSIAPWTDAPTTAISPTVLGLGGRAMPSSIINDDFIGSGNIGSGNVETGGDFDPINEGIDFFESLEGMLVQINNPLATSPTANFGTSEEIWVLADNGDNATSRTVRGGSLITPSDFNPERIQIDDLNSAIVLPDVNVGTKLSTVTGVVNYDFNNYEVLVSAAPTIVEASPLQKEITSLTSTDTQLTIATFNVENLDPSDGTAKFNAIAAAVVNNLQSPDIINLEEIQDNNGATNNGVVDADQTFQLLIDAIAIAGGPTYEYRQINPVNNQDGGQPGGNIRVGFLFNPQRVDFVEGSLQRLTDTDLSDGDAFQSSRKPLVGQFVFNEQTLTVIGNHFNSKGGDQPLFGPNQPPTLTSEVQRNQQATIVKDFVQQILADDPSANVVVAGDLNDFEFSAPLSILESGGLNTLIETLPANERYTYNFQGNAQVLDHILVSNSLLSQLDGVDVVHINSEFSDQVSDHDPVLARFNLPLPNQAPTAVTFENVTAALPENSDTQSRIKVADVVIADDGRGINELSLSGEDAGFFELDGSVLYLKANTALDFESKPSYAVTVNVDDVAVGSTPDASSSFTLNLTNVNEAPTANDDRVILPRGVTTIAVAALLANDTDPDTDPDSSTTLAITGVQTAVGGTATLRNGSIEFSPAPGFNGTASFDYVVSDGELSDTATVTVVMGQTLNGGNGNDTLRGNDGDDVISGGNGRDQLFGLGGEDVLNGGNGDDQIFGGEGQDVLNGGNGNDKLFGELGADVLIGGNGDDQIFGGAGDDFLIGENGNDLLVGGLGADILTGGNGRDTFQFAAGDSLLGSYDRITDLKIGTDIIDGPNAVSAANLLELGAVATFDGAGITAILGALPAFRAATFTFGAQTFLALNDGTAGFSASADTIVEITGFSGRLDRLAVV